MSRYLLLAGIAIFTFGYVLELGGFFLYFGYTAEKILACLSAAAFLVWGMLLLRKHKRVEGMAALLICVALLALGWTLAGAITSPRKRFYLLAEKVRSGDAIGNVKTLLAGYRNWSTEDGHITFQFTSPGTSDVLVVHYDLKTSKVLEARLSLD